MGKENGTSAKTKSKPTTTPKDPQTQPFKRGMARAGHDRIQLLEEPEEEPAVCTYGNLRTFFQMFWNAYERRVGNEKTTILQ